MRFAIDVLSTTLSLSHRIVLIAGGGPSGITFSTTIETVPAAGSLALIGVAGLVSCRRRGH